MDAAAELWRNPVSKDQIQPEYGDEQADAGGETHDFTWRVEVLILSRIQHRQSKGKWGLMITLS